MADEQLKKLDKEVQVRTAKNIGNVLMNAEGMIAPMIEFIQHNPQLKHNIKVAKNIQSILRHKSLGNRLNDAVTNMQKMMNINPEFVERLGNICSFINPEVTAATITNLQAMSVILGDIVGSEAETLLYLDITLVERVMKSGVETAENMTNILSEVSQLSQCSDKNIKRKVKKLCRNAASSMAEFSQNVRYAEEGLHNAQKHREPNREPINIFQDMSCILSSWIKRLLKRSIVLLVNIALTLTLSGALYIAIDAAVLKTAHETVDSPLASMLNVIRQSYESGRMEAPLVLDYIQTPIRIEGSLRIQSIWDRYKRMLTVDARITNANELYSYVTKFNKAVRNENHSEIAMLKAMMPTYYVGGPVYAAIAAPTGKIIEFLQALYKFLDTAVQGWVSQRVKQLQLANALSNVVLLGTIGSLTDHAFSTAVSYFSNENDFAIKTLSTMGANRIAFVLMLSMWITSKILSFPVELYLLVIKIAEWWERLGTMRALESDRNPIIGYTCMYGRSADESRPPDHVCRPRLSGEYVSSKVSASAQECEVECNNTKLMNWLVDVNNKFYLEPEKFYGIMERTLEYVKKGVTKTECKMMSFGSGACLWLKICDKYVTFVNNDVKKGIQLLKPMIMSLREYIIESQACWKNTSKLRQVLIDADLLLKKTNK